MFEKGHVPKLNYSAIVESHKLGLVKPEKEFFLYAQKLSSVEPEEILFIDDSQKNVDFANQLGWNAFFFDTSNQSRSISKIKEILARILGIQTCQFSQNLFATLVANPRQDNLDFHKLIAVHH